MNTLYRGYIFSGKLTVLEVNNTYSSYQCLCSNILEVQNTKLKTKHTQSPWSPSIDKKDPKKGTKSKVVETITQYTGSGFKPLKGSKLTKEGFYSTDKNTLKQLKPTNKKQKLIIHSLLERSIVKKQLSTFRGENGKGLINKVDYNGILHPKYNNTVTTTGRLSSSDPNGQSCAQGAPPHVP